LFFFRLLSTIKGWNFFSLSLSALHISLSISCFLGFNECEEVLAYKLHHNVESEEGFALAASEKAIKSSTAAEHQQQNIKGTHTHTLSSSSLLHSLIPIYLPHFASLFRLEQQMKR
jgi:hypothetical protein